MFAYLCNFTPCKWLHVHGHIYQCRRCKTVSAGAHRDIGGDAVRDAVEEVRAELAKTMAPCGGCGANWGYDHKADCPDMAANLARESETI